MSEQTTFHDLVRRARAGDAGAAEELVRRYEPTIRLVVRRRLKHPALRRLVDSLDICQAVWGSFFLRVATGHYELATPQRLQGLLAVMARNKVINLAKRLPPRQVESGSVLAREAVAKIPQPDRRLEHQELLRELRARLSDQDRQVMDWRASGDAWDRIAARVGGNPDAVRIRFGRTVKRIARELGIEP
jgi:DNA-directed RNA polymerase specialized sigma24 family protein